MSCNIGGFCIDFIIQLSYNKHSSQRKGFKKWKDGYTMALIHCPECGKEISNMTQACPNCGKPIQKDTYVLVKRLPGDSCKASVFFMVITWVLWIGGVAIAVFSSITPEYGYYSSANAFQWKDFFVILLTYFLYGAVSYCMASVIDYIHGIYQAVTSLELIERKKWSQNNPPKHSIAKWCVRRINTDTARTSFINLKLPMAYASCS